ncbi:PPK2 family polyphosphate kinase [Aureibaculum sp. 2210JD6-5]|uniref:PPK2 family polyphosphate kinase n=1 Tax=Aureibaculum sp. 2210JD6-5 TaxID=3103957 RepID=UPI002AACCE68|nr:PPK2 family polyphosphate kinase [Aureibaculum sp. 2210JD6-5]MDY7394366.1 PPK2 family polyphosphate kinase [Aureibaculum sp. 2210JD6-5]
MISSKYKITSPINLTEIVTKEVDVDAKKKLKIARKQLSDVQDKMYAHGKYSMLVCLQGMDTSGKDSLIREVFKQVNARGVVVHSFKVPTENELKHDYLWRHYVALPQRGKIGVFNRTHYENVLVTRVHPEYILGENIPSVKNINDINDEFFHKRMEHITNFEQHIAENGTIVLKFFLHLSKEEQKNRLLRRIEKENKNWKFSADDLKERKLWNKYQDFYRDAINRTSTEKAPWYIIPADDKPTARIIVAEIILETLESYDDIRYPELDEKTKARLSEFREQLDKG